MSTLHDLHNLLKRIFPALTAIDKLKKSGNVLSVIFLQKNQTVSIVKIQLTTFTFDSLHEYKVFAYEQINKVSPTPLYCALATAPKICKDVYSRWLCATQYGLKCKPVTEYLSYVKKVIKLTESGDYTELARLKKEIAYSKTLPFILEKKAIEFINLSHYLLFITGIEPLTPGACANVLRTHGFKAVVKNNVLYMPHCGELVPCDVASTFSYARKKHIAYLNHRYAA